MVLSMARPAARKGSSLRQFRQRIPADVRSKAVGAVLVVPVGERTASCKIGESTSVVQFSLQTRDPAEAKARHAVALVHVEAFWSALRSGPTRLTHKQVVALAGETYREIVAAHENDPGSTEGWQFLERLATMRPMGSGLQIGMDRSPGRPRLTFLDEVLGRHSLVVDDDSQRRLVDAVREAQADAARRLQENARGDYGPDERVKRFPPVERAATSARSLEKITLTELVEGWWRESERTGTKRRTYEGYRNTVRALVRFLGHEEAHKVTTEDIIRFKDFRLAELSPRTNKPVSARTVKDSDLAGLKSVFNWAVGNRKVAANPAVGVTIKLRKPAKLREKGFTEEEVAALLSASARLEKADNELSQTFALKHWVPWVLAYTGARVSEIVQLRRQDVRRTGDHWSLFITPEAGSVKDNEARQVPLHPHLVELGFVGFVERSTDEYLFVRPREKTGDVAGPVRGAVNRLREFARHYVTDPKVKPNHGWRHLFVTRSRQHGLDLELRRMITGHAGAHVDEREYGDPAGLYRELCKLPRFELEEKQGPAPGSR